MPVARPLVAAIGVIAVWPLLFFAALAATLAGLRADPALLSSTPEFALWFRVYLVTMVVTVGLMAYFVVDVFNNDRLDADARLAWLAALFFGNVFVFPVYWFAHMWRGGAATPRRGR